jgi:hypothetical protein
MNKMYPELSRLAPHLPDATTLSGVTLEWLHDGQIPCFTLADISRATVDDWMRLLAQLMEYWPADLPYAAIIDATPSGGMLTPYARAKVGDLEGINPSLQGRVAVILPRTFVAQLIRLFVRTLRRQKVVTGIFFTREEALDWVKQVVPAPRS